MCLFVQGKYLTPDLPCNLFGYLDKCEMEFYNYLKLNLETENELEQQSMTYEQYWLRHFFKSFC